VSNDWITVNNERDDFKIPKGWALGIEEVGSVCKIYDFCSSVPGSTGNPDSLFVIFFCPSSGNSGLKATDRGGP
jgi:hypothetical protein